VGELTLAETCPPRAALLRYASGGRDPDIAGHISRCDRCACFVSEAMEADAGIPDADIIDITPQPTLRDRVREFVRKLL